MTRLRMRVADRLKGAQNTYAMLSTFNEIDMTGLMQLRSDYKVRGTNCCAAAAHDHPSTCPFTGAQQNGVVKAGVLAHSA